MYMMYQLQAATMTVCASGLTLSKGIKVDQATQKGSVYDVIRFVTKKKGCHAVQTFSRIQKHHNEFITKVVKLRINGKGKKTPVADASILQKIAVACLRQSRMRSRPETAKVVRDGAS